MSSAPFSIPIAGTADASGVAVVNLREFLSQWDFQVWSVALVCAGTSPLLQVQVNGTPYLSGAGSNPSVGPVYTHPGDVPALVLSGLTPSSSFSGLLQGSSADAFDELDPLSAPSSNNVTIAGGSVTLAGPATITGPVTVQQSSPQSLLTGQVGAALVNNVSDVVAASGFNRYGGALGFDVSGYGGLLLTGGNNTAAAALHAQLQWLDGSGLVVGFTEIPDLRSAFCVAYACLSTRVQVFVYNISGANHAVTNFSVIPLVNLPPSHADLLQDNGGVTSSTVGNDPRILLFAGATSVPASSALTVDGSVVYNGRAIWHAGAATGLTATNWWAELQGLDASGSPWTLAKLGGIAQQPPVEVALPALHTQVILHNTGASSVNLGTTLVAA